MTVTAVNDVPVRTAGTLTPISGGEDSANSTAVTLGLSGVTYGPGGGADEAEPDADVHGDGDSVLRADLQGGRDDAGAGERHGDGGGTAGAEVQDGGQRQRDGEPDLDGDGQRDAARR